MSISISLSVPSTFRNVVLDTTTLEENAYLLTAGVEALKMARSSSATLGQEAARKGGEEMGRLAAERAHAQRIKAIEDENAKLQSSVEVLKSTVSARERDIETLCAQKSSLDDRLRVTKGAIDSTRDEAIKKQRELDEEFMAQLRTELESAKRELKKNKEEADKRYDLTVQHADKRLEDSLAKIVLAYGASTAKLEADLKESKIYIDVLRKESKAGEESVRKESAVRVEALRKEKENSENALRRASEVKEEALRKEKEDSENALRKASEAKEEALQTQIADLRKRVELQIGRNAGSSTKGADAENEIALLLHTSLGMMPGYKMLEHKIRSGDHIVEFDKMRLMFETKDKATLKKVEDIDKVYRDMENHPECDAVVFISKVSDIPEHHRSGNFDISATTDGRPMIWIGKFDEKPDKVAYMQMVHLVVLELVKMARTLDKSTGVELLEFYKGKVATLRKHMKYTSSDLDEIVDKLKKYKSVQSTAFTTMEAEVKGIVAKFKHRLEDAMKDDDEEVAPLPATNSSASTPPVEVPTIVESSAPIISRPMPSLPHVVPTIIESSVPLGSSLSSSGFNAVKVSMMDTPLDYKMKVAELKKLNKAELKQRCKDSKIKGVTGKSKEELIAMLS